jgi:hypothetical protein
MDDWRTQSGGRVARRNGPVARSTQTTSAGLFAASPTFNHTQ